MFFSGPPSYLYGSSTVGKKVFALLYNMIAATPLEASKDTRRGGEGDDSHF